LLRKKNEERERRKEIDAFENTILTRRIAYKKKRRFPPDEKIRRRRKERAEEKDSKKKEEYRTDQKVSGLTVWPRRNPSQAKEGHQRSRANHQKMDKENREEIEKKQ